MKNKALIIIVLLIIVFLVSCSTSDERSNKSIGTSENKIVMDYKIPNDVSGQPIEKELKRICEEHLKKHPDIGTPNELQLIYTTYNFPQPDGSSAFVFFIANRSGFDIEKDMTLKINMTYKDKVVYKDAGYFYDVSAYGSIPNNYITPISLMMDKKQIETLLGSGKNQKDVKLYVDAYIEDK